MLLVFFTLSSRFRGSRGSLHLIDASPPDPLQTPSRPPPDPFQTFVPLTYCTTHHEDAPDPLQTPLRTLPTSPLIRPAAFRAPGERGVGGGAAHRQEARQPRLWGGLCGPAVRGQRGVPGGARRRARRRLPRGDGHGGAAVHVAAACGRAVQGGGGQDAVRHAQGQGSHGSHGERPRVGPLHGPRIYSLQGGKQKIGTIGHPV
eukprot:1185393-Prorocentrum_minimum.AAC.1